MILLEARSSAEYYESEAYPLVKKYGNIIVSIIKEGMEQGEIRADIDPKSVRQVIMGAIEHACYAGIMFKREISPDIITDNLCEIIFGGIKNG